MGWLIGYQHFWSENLDRLAATFVEQDEWSSIQTTPATQRASASQALPSSQASPSNVASRHRLKKVYAAWTDPEKIVRWSGRADAKPGRADINAEAGGCFRIGFSTDAEEYEVGGVYREVVANQRLVFSQAWHSTPERESLVTVSLQPDGDGTLLTLLHQQLFDQTARDGHERGWIGGLDKLEKHVT